MPSNKRLVSCAPCAKRKVRCDKLQPCCHCKRRPQDDCVYPDLSSALDSRLETHSKRIEKLEEYIRSLGGDPEQAYQNENSSNSNLQGLQLRHLIDGPGNQHQSNPTEVIGETSRLLKRDEQVTYIETPMWYSWSGTNEHEQGSTDTPVRQGQGLSSSPSRTFCFPTILDPSNIPGVEALCAQFPPADKITLLWRTYLANVHPLVKIFFDWEIEPIIHRACEDILSLSNGEKALVSAIIFISTLSLTDEKCQFVLSDEKPEILRRYQRCAEDALLHAEFATTSDKLTLQAFMVYLLAMRERTRPAAMFSLMGMANRIAERMGLHRDGEKLGLGVVRAEERRRTWWQLQFMDIAVARLVGSLSITLYAAWDCRLPSSLEDSDLKPDAMFLPDERSGITSMSYCLWRYNILYMQRQMRQASADSEGLSWMLSSNVRLAEKETKINSIERTMGEKFLQYCEPLTPLHVYIQVGIRQFLIALRRTARQPALVNARISEMSLRERDEFLSLSTRCLEYYLITQTAESLAGFRWHNESYFQWIALVYVILEAHHRLDNIEEVLDLWSLIRRIFTVHPELSTASLSPKTGTITRMTLAAWQKFELRCRNPQTRAEKAIPDSLEIWITELSQRVDLPLVSSTSELDHTTPMEFDFDMFDWSAWEEPYLSTGIYANEN